MEEPKLRFKEGNGMQFPDWEKSKFSDVFDNINNSTFSRDCLNYVDGNVKYIHYGDILTTFDSTVNVEASNVPYVNKDIDCQKYQLLSDGDITVADTAEDDTVGKAVEIINANNVKVISGLHTIACRPKLKFTSGYLGYYMNSNPYHNQLRPYMQGVKVTSISKANIALTNVSIPSLPEQQKIASLFSEVDALIQSAEKELEGYRELKQGMLQKMFPKKGEKVPEIRFPEFTGDWEEKTFNDIAVYKKGPFGSALKKKIFVPKSNNTVKVYEQQNAISKDWRLERYFVTDEYFQANMKSFSVSGGDIIVSCAGTIGEIYELPNDAEEGIINQALMRVRIKKSVINSMVFKCVFDKMISSEGIKISNGSALKNIPPFADMKKQPVLLPSLPEQEKIGKYFTNLDNLIALQQKELDGYKELKKGLLQQMFY